jgi:hypothetical protein
MSPFLHIAREAAEDPLAATRAIMARIAALDKAAQRAALDSLAAWRQEILAQIIKAEGFDAMRLPKLLMSVDRLADDWAQKYSIDSRELVRRGFEIGIDKVDDPLRAAGIDVRFPEPSLSVLQASRVATVDLITRLSLDAREEIKREILLAANGAKTPFEALKEIEATLDDPATFGTIANRAEIITRTETGRVLSLATQARQEEAAKVVAGLKKQWLWSGVSRLNHRAINGQVREIDEPFDLPASRTCPAEQLMFPRDPNGSACNTVNCFLPGAEVSGEFIGGSKAFYAGPAREITSRRGYKLAVTPNHPVMTEHGLIFAHRLQKGDRLLSHAVRKDGFVFGMKNKQDRPSLIENVFDAVAVESLTVPVVKVGGNFHGDAVNMKGEIHAVRSDRVHPAGEAAGLLQLGVDFVLKVAGVKQRDLTSFGPSLHPRRRYGGSPTGAPGGSALRFDRSPVALEFRPYDTSGCGNISDGNLAIAEPFSESAARNAELASELLDRCPGAIALDDVVEVRDFYYLGHVYDLESTSGLLIAENILTSNCGCQSIPYKSDWNLQKLAA